MVSKRHATFLHNEVPGVFIPEEAIGRIEAAGDEGAGCSHVVEQDRRGNDDATGRIRTFIGRLGAGAFSGLGYLDGALGQWAITPSFKVGGFFGAAAEVDSLGFESTG